jgi:hypothetical protein
MRGHKHACTTEGYLSRMSGDEGVGAADRQRRLPGARKRRLTLAPCPTGRRGSPAAASAAKVSAIFADFDVGEQSSDDSEEIWEAQDQCGLSSDPLRACSLTWDSFRPE